MFNFTFGKSVIAWTLLSSVIMATNEGQQKAIYDIYERLSCQVSVGSHLYDLRGLSVENGHKLNLEKYGSNMQLQFNFCKQFNQESTSIQEDWCLDPDLQTFAYIKDSDEQWCQALTSSSLYASGLAIDDEYQPS